MSTKRKPTKRAGKKPAARSKPTKAERSVYDSELILSWLGDRGALTLAALTLAEIARGDYTPEQFRADLDWLA
jgi:NhaP-type Na+/H+ or K+/H+ antiporter